MSANDKARVSRRVRAIIADNPSHADRIRTLAVGGGLDVE
jgi:hypothetical protein